MTSSTPRVMSWRGSDVRTTFLVDVGSGEPLSERTNEAALWKHHAGQRNVQRDGRRDDAR